MGEEVVLDDVRAVFQAHVPPDKDIEAAVAQLSARREVIYALIDRPLFHGYTPNDPLFGAQWYLNNAAASVCGYPSYPSGSSQFGNGFGQYVWDETRGAGVPVAILDSGVDPYHEDLYDRVMFGPSFISGQPYSYDDYGHGTAVAGLALASINNSLGIVGAAPEGIPWSVKVLNSSNVGTALEAARGVEWAGRSGMPIVNLSLGGYLGTSGYSTMADVKFISDACRLAWRLGSLLVASSGNRNLGVDGSELALPAYPAALPTVLSVGAILPDAQRWEDRLIRPAYCSSSPAQCQFSNYGPWLDVVGPGGRFITTTRWSGGYWNLDQCNSASFASMGFSGTSASAPIVSGIGALLKSASPNLAGEDVRALLIRTAVNPEVLPGSRDDFQGYGRVRAWNARALLSGNAVIHFGAGAYPGATASLQDIEQAEVFVTFYRVDGLVDSHPYRCIRHRLSANAPIPVGMTAVAAAWARPSGSRGWRLIANNSTYDDALEADWAGTVGSPTLSSVGLETYVYEIYDGMSFVGWFPCEPNMARIAATVIGATSTTGVAGEGVSLEFGVRPNPTRGDVVCMVTIGTGSPGQLSMLDIQGRVVRRLEIGWIPKGAHEIRIRKVDGEPLSPGVYFVRVKAKQVDVQRRLIIID